MHSSNLVVVCCLKMNDFYCQNAVRSPPSPANAGLFVEMELGFSSLISCVRCCYFSSLVLLFRSHVFKENISVLFILITCVVSSYSR